MTNTMALSHFATGVLTAALLLTSGPSHGAAIDNHGRLGVPVEEFAALTISAVLEDEAGTGRSALRAPQNQITLRHNNDFLTGNSRDDDLYTSALGFAIEFDRDRSRGTGLGRRFLLFEENMFTDGDVDRRFDETWLLLGRRAQRGEWTLSLYGGGVHVGRGLFGEDLQNGMHELIGDDPIEFDYVSSNRIFVVAGLDVERPLYLHDGLQVSARGEVRVTPEFQQWAKAAARLRWQARSWLEVFAGLGVRYSDTQYEPLEPWIVELAPTAEAGVVLAERIEFSWTHNQYGTEMGHVSLGYRLPLKAVLP